MIDPAQLAPWITLAIGVLMALAGYPIYRISLKMAGAVLGFYLGHIIGRLLGDLFSSRAHAQWISIAMALLLALIGGSILREWIRILLFVAGFALGVMVVAVPSGAIGAEELPSVIPVLLDSLRAGDLLPLAAGLIGGVLGVLLERPIIILLTSLWGAILVKSIFPAPWVLGAVLIGGVLAQAVLFRKRRRREA
jgi:hypothetical protein